MGAGKVLIPPDTFKDRSLTLSLSTSPTPSRGDSWLVHSRRGWKKLPRNHFSHFPVRIILTNIHLHVLRVITTPMFCPRIWSRSLAQSPWNSIKLLAKRVVLSEIKKRSWFWPDSSKLARKATIRMIWRMRPVSMSFTLLCSQ